MGMRAGFFCCFDLCAIAGLVNDIVLPSLKLAECSFQRNSGPEETKRNRSRSGAMTGSSKSLLFLQPRSTVRN